MDAGAAGVRRHQSLNYPNAGGVRRLNTGLKRAGTLQAPPIRGHPQQTYSGAQSPSPTGADEEYDYDDDSVRAEEDGYFRVPNQQPQGQYPTSPIGRSSPWSTPGAGNDWRTQLGGNVNPNIGAGSSGIDDVSRALNALEINQQYAGNAANGYSQGQYDRPPRFNPPHNFDLEQPGMRNNGNGGNGAARKLQLVTDLETQPGSIQSASAYVPPIGHGVPPVQPPRQSDEQQQQQHPHRDRAFTASGSNPWDSKERLLGGKLSNPNLHHLYQGNNGNVPSVPPLPAHYINNQSQPPRLGLANANNGNQQPQSNRGNSQGSTQSPPGDNFITSPIDVPSLIAAKGYNPVDFDTRPLFVSLLFDVFC